MADNIASISLTLNTETYDVLHAYDNTSNSQYYAGTNFELDVQAGKTYAVTLDRPENSPTRLYVYYSTFLTLPSFYNDIVRYDYSEYMYGGATRGSLIFEALNTTTVRFRVIAETIQIHISQMAEFRWLHGNWMPTSPRTII